MENKLLNKRWFIVIVTLLVLNQDVLGQLTLTTNQTNVMCKGASTGSATVVPSNGTNHYSYSWSPSGGTNATATGLSAGTYTVTVIDTLTTGGAIDSLYIQDFEGVHGWTLNVVTGVQGSDPNFWTVSANEGGVAPGGCGVSSNGNKTLHITSVFNPFGGAAYDPGGLCGFLFCPRTSSRAESPSFSTLNHTSTRLEFDFISLGEGLNDNASVYYDSGTGWQLLTSSIKSSICGGGQGQWTHFNMALPASCDNNASVKIAINWVNNDDGVGTDPSVAINDVLVKGTSTLNISYSSENATVNITEPATSITSTISTQTNVLCNGASNGSAMVSASGGTGSYTYSWAPSGGNTATATGLTAGSYTCTITDANLCTKTQNVSITEPLPLGITYITTNVNCYGEANGAINVTPSGGTAPYSYNWGGGITTEDRIGLTAGSYSVTITDANGCFASFAINVTQPPILNSSIAITDASCYAASDGALDITVSGGTAPYSYFWISSITSEDLSSQSSGTYSVEISDAHGCTLNDTAIISQPTEIISTSLITNVDCFGNSTGAIDIDPSGGFGPYTYNWGGGITTEDRTSLTAGTYSIAITDATSCVSNISVTVSEPSILSATNSAVNVACFGDSTGSIDLTVSGGTVPYTYDWGGGLTSQDLTNLASGSYTVSVIDDHGCTTTSNAMLTQPTAISVVKDSLNIFCYGDNSGMANVTVSGGVGPYSYNWNGTSAFTPTANFLTAGNYSVEITDNNGCMKTADFALTQNPAITSSFNISQCDPYTWESNFYPISGTYQQIFSAVNGCDSTVTLNLNVFGYPTISISASETIVCAEETVTLNATGGVSTATWDNGVINNQAFVPTSSTTYTATIANAQGCVTIESIDVFVRDLPLVFMENFSDSTCLDANVVACPFATPAGGIYSGSGVTGVLLNTQIASLGQHEVIYTFSDQFGCTNTDTSVVNIVECELPLNETGISEKDAQLIQIWPNPTFGTVQIETTTDVSAVITDCFGKIIQQLDLKTGQTQIDLSNESMGVYFIVIQDTTQQVIRLIKN